MSQDVQLAIVNSLPAIIAAIFAGIGALYAVKANKHSQEAHRQGQANGAATEKLSEQVANITPPPAS